MAFNLKGRAAIVYGGSYGIGKGISQVLARAGANVAIIARDKEKGVAALDTLDGNNHIFIEGDVSKIDDQKRIATSVINKYAGIDIIVCCAGVYSEYKLDDEKYTEHYISNMININLKGSIYSLRATLPYLKKSPCGRVILISSITGEFTGMPGWTVYGATKSGQIGFARSAAVELAKHKITVNCICPGNIETESLKNLGQTYINDIIKSVPLGRLGSPEDIGNAVLFLASSEASFITGQEITVDGGQVRPESLGFNEQLN